MSSLESRGSRIDRRRATDEQLAALTAAGDMGAFTELVERHRDVVVRVAERIVGAGHGEDVAQDSLLRAFHRMRQFRGDSSFRAWLLRITHNTALNEATRRRRAGPEPVEDVLADASEAHTPATALEEHERTARLALKLREVRPTHRAVLVLRDLEGLSYEEIADVTETPLGSVKGRLFRARQELIDILRQNTYDWELPA